MDLASQGKRKDRDATEEAEDDDDEDDPLMAAIKGINIMDNQAADNPERQLRVNAGGEVFTTLASTLTQCGKGPLLDAVEPYLQMHQDRESLRTAPPLFLDVDPKLFEALLRVLRMRRMAVARKVSAGQAASIRHPPRMDMVNVDVEADQWKFLVHYYQLGKFLDNVSSGEVEKEAAPKSAWHGRKRAKSGLLTYELATGGQVVAEGHGDGENGGVIIIHLPDGQTVTTLASTLQVRDSRLTAMVEQALQAVASAGAAGGAGLEVFLDVEPECCRLLVNFLRLRRMGQYHEPPLLPLIPEVPVHLHQDWETMLDYLQLREDVEGIRDVLPGFVLSGNLASRQARLNSSGGAKKGNAPEVIEISDSDDDDPLSKALKEAPAPTPPPALLAVKSETTPSGEGVGTRMRRASEAADDSDDDMQDTTMDAGPSEGPGEGPASGAPVTRVERAGSVLSTYTDGLEVGYQGLRVDITEGSVRVPIQPLLTAPGTYYLQLRIDIEDLNTQADTGMDTKPSASSASLLGRKPKKPKKPNVRLFLQRVRDGKSLGYGFESSQLMRTKVAHVLKVDLLRGQMMMRDTSTDRVSWMATPFLRDDDKSWKDASQAPPDFANDLFFDPATGHLEYGGKYQLCLGITAAESRLQDKGFKGHVVKVAFMPVSKKLYFSNWTNRDIVHETSVCVVCKLAPIIGTRYHRWSTNRSIKEEEDICDRCHSRLVQHGPYLEVAFERPRRLLPHELKAIKMRFAKSTTTTTTNDRTPNRSQPPYNRTVARPSSFSRAGSRPCSSPRLVAN